MLSYRRREHLLRVAQWLADLPSINEVAALELQGVNMPASRQQAAKLMELNEQARELGRQAALLAMPDGAVEFRGGDPDAIPIQREGITLVVPGETPCDVLDGLFEIAKALGPVDEPLTIEKLVAMSQSARQGLDRPRPNGYLGMETT